MKTYRIQRPKMVVIGGGTGLPVILKSLRDESADITAIVTVADDGGSSGILRKDMKIAPPGDLRNVLVSLSDMPQLYEDIFQYRFSLPDTSLGNHTIGNLIIAALSEMRSSTYEAVQLLRKMMHVESQVYPVSEEAQTLHAIFADGTEAVGESTISKQRKRIDRVFVTNAYNDQTPKASRKVVQSILDADMIVLGPGSLFTSILPNLMIDEIREALKATKAEIVYICNIMTQKGETEQFSDADHIRVLHRHLAMPFVTTVLVNTEVVPGEYMNSKKFDEYLVQVKHDFEGMRAEGCRVISTDFLELRDGGAFHDGQKVAEELFHIIYDRTHQSER